MFALFRLLFAVWALTVLDPALALTSRQRAVLFIGAVKPAGGGGSSSGVSTILKNELHLTPGAFGIL